MKLCVNLFVIWCIILQFAYSARILVVFHIPTQSHNSLGLTLVKKLVSRGHEVTYVSAYNNTDIIPNLEFIHLENMQEVMDRCLSPPNLFKRQTDNLRRKIKFFCDFGVAMTKGALENENMQELLERNENYDVVILEYLRSEALMGIAAHFKAHLILFSTYSNIGVNRFTGNIAPYSFLSDITVSFREKMTFFERLHNGLVRFYIDYVYRTKDLPAQGLLYDSYFKNDGKFEEVLKNVSLVLTNTHVTLEIPQPSMPNMISIGGFHVKKPKTLPNDLENFLNEAKNGAIFFSFGSNLKASNLPYEKIDIFMKTFKKLENLKILWKFEDENLKTPANVLIRKWFPQNEILAHPNLKAFISHGGMLSLTEAVYRGVPMISFPFYGDQSSNSLVLERNEMGIKMDFNNFNESTLTDAILKVLRKKYQENARKISRIINDQPDRPLDRAIFWIEHILRHGGADHLKSAAVELNWFQYLSMDVIVFIFTIIFFALTIILTILAVVLNISYKYLYKFYKHTQIYLDRIQTQNEKKQT